MVARADSAPPEDEQLAEPPVILLQGRFPPNAAVLRMPKPYWPMAAITNSPLCNDNNFPIIFPPINHENLEIHSDPIAIPKPIAQIHEDNSSVTSPLYNQQISYSGSDSDSDSDSFANSNSSATFSPSDSSSLVHSPLFSSPRRKPTSRWIDSWTEILQSKVNGIVRYLWCSFTPSRGVLLTFLPGSLTAVLIIFLYFRQRRRLMVGEESSARLNGIIKQKDEKINQLLDQISVLNQVLLARLRVPSSPST